LPEPSPSKFSHVDLVVSDLERSLDFYRGLLMPLGWTGLNEVHGERGETIHYISQTGPGVAALGLRQRPGDAPQHPYDRYALGMHHVCFDAPSREAVDERARWLADRDAVIESGPAEYGYTPGYYAVFFHDPDGIKLELLHRPGYWEYARGAG
jgi:catechol 2,3-dioxygenase-like lactoylglutathione lyase family enzyme